MSRRPVLLSVLAASIALTACGGDDDSSAPSTPATPAPAAASEQAEPAGEPSLRVVSPDDAAQTIAEAPDGLVILDVRTPEEFNEGHIDGAVMLDFYSDEFTEELAKLDPNVPYVLYCRSGNRSGQTLEIMEGFGFTDVEDVEGGIINWQSAGLPLVSG